MRAQSSIISSMLLVAIVLGLIGMAYMWGKPMFEKSRSLSSYEYSKSKLMEIKKAAMIVSKTNNAQQSVSVDTTSISLSVETGDYAKNESSKMTVHKNAIDLTQTLGMPMVQSDTWIFADPEEDNSNFLGSMGGDSAGVLLARSDGQNTITRLWFRDLYDPSTGRYYRMNLSSAGASTASGGQNKILFKNLGTREVQIGGLSYTVTNLQVRID